MAEPDARLRSLVTEYIESADVMRVDLRSVRARAQGIRRRRRLVLAAAGLCATGALGAITGYGVRSRVGDSTPQEVAGDPGSIALETLTPAVTVVTSDWEPVAEGRGYVVLAHDASSVSVTLLNPDGVFESTRDAAASAPVEVPPNLHGLLLVHDGLESRVQAGIPTSIGSFPASYLDLEVLEPAEGACATPCLPLFVVGDHRVDLSASGMHRIVIANADGSRLIAVIDAPRRGFSGAVVPAMQLLTSVTAR